jgi:hypothetical protein
MSHRSSGNAASTGTANLDGVLRRFLALIPDARQISINTNEDAELLSENRLELNSEDSHTISSLAPSFSTSVEQSSRLGRPVQPCFP